MRSSDIILSSEALSRDRCLEFVLLDSAGGTVLFEGTVRDHTHGKSVVRLEFEAYEPMAISEMEKIAERALQHFDVHRIAIHHRVGVLQIGEVPVLIAVSASHRKAAFEACQFAIDELKKTVPIWKKEIFEDGSQWVAAHP